PADGRGASPPDPPPPRALGRYAMKLVDPDAPFFRPLWVRVICVILPLVWAGVELWSGSPAWAMLFGAAGIYLGLALFVWRQPEP
uniref:hypothetical protein n=1 Tax=Paracoccus sp. PAMC 22219 TaxID=1569209 RepID=UPI001E5A926F